MFFPWPGYYEIALHACLSAARTLITLSKNALIYLAKLIDNPDSFADNFMTSIFRLNFNNLAPFEKTGFVTSWFKEMSYHILVEPFCGILLRH